MTWRQWFSNPYRAIGTVIFVIIFAQPIGMAIGATINTLLPVVLIGAIIFWGLRTILRL